MPAKDEFAPISIQNSYWHVYIGNWMARVWDPVNLVVIGSLHLHEALNCSFYEQHVAWA